MSLIAMLVGARLAPRNLKQKREAAVRQNNVRPQFLIALFILLCLAQTGFAIQQDASNYDRLERAAEMIRKGRVSEAERELKAVLGQSPREANALNLLGVIRAQQRRLEEAEQLFLRSIEANDALLGAYLNLGQLYQEVGKPDRALWAFTEASHIAPDNPDINFNLATLYEAERQYERALEYLVKIPPQQSGPDHLYLLIKSHLGLGHVQEAVSLSAALKEPGKVPADMAAAFAVVFAERKLLDDAIQILEAARKGGVPSFALLYNLAASYRQKGELKLAEETYLAALALKPDDLLALRALASMAREAGDLEKALSFLVRARKVAPDSPAVLYDFGWTALNLNLIYDALQVLERLHQMKPDDPGYLYALAIARLQNGEAERAQQLSKRYVELRPQDSRGYYVLGATLYSLQQYSQARAALEQSVALSPYPVAEYYLGMIAYHEGDTAKATFWLERTLTSEPNYQAAHTALGMVYAKQKNYEKARDELERALQLDSKDATASYQLGLVYARLGNKARAQAMFSAAEQLRGEKQKHENLRFRLMDPPK